MPSIQYPLSMHGDMVSAYYAGFSNAETAELLGISNQTITMWMRVEKRKFPRRHTRRRSPQESKRPNERMPWEIFEAVLSCVSAGFTQVEAQRLIGVNQTTISSWLRKAQENKPGGSGDYRHAKRIRHEAARLSYGGAPSADVAQLLHISAADARQYALDAGIHANTYSRGLPLMPTIPIQLA